MVPLITLLVLLAQSDQPGAPSPVYSRWFVQPALTLTVQPASGETYHRVSPNLSGHAFGAGVEAGGFLTPTLALEGEFVFGGTISAPQRFSYAWTDDYVAENRDLLLNQLLRWRPRGTSPLAIVGGGGLAVTSASQRSIVHTPGYPPGTTYTYPDSTVRLYGLTLSGGVDAVFPVSRAIAIGPTFRLRWTHRPMPAATGWLGVGEYAFNVGVAVRAGF